jgi:hypothetical protein
MGEIMFGKIGAPAGQGFGYQSRPLHSDIKTFEQDIGKTVKRMLLSLGCLALGVGLMVNELQYWHEQVYSKLFFASCLFLVIGVVGLLVFVSDMSGRGENYLQLSSSGIRARGWASEIKWSEIENLHVHQTKTHGVVANTSLYLLANSQVMNRVAPGVLRQLGRALNAAFAAPGLRLPTDKIEGDTDAVGQMISVYWAKYRHV